MVDYEKVQGPVEEKEPEDSGAVCPGCKKQNLVIKRVSNVSGSTETQHLLCTLCNYQDSRLFDKKTGETLVGR